MQMQYHITIMCNREEQANLGIDSKNLILRAKGQMIEFRKTTED